MSETSSASLLNRQISIHELPISISDLDAIEVCYREQIDLAYQRLTARYRVLIRCEKGLNAFVYPALRSRFRRGGDTQLTLIDGRGSPEEEGSRRAQVMLSQLTQFIRGGVTDQSVAALTHLDVLSTSGSTLNAEAREVIPLLYEHPHAKICAFVDPSLPLHQSLVDVFDLQIDLSGIPREKLPFLITQREARALHFKAFDPFLLYPYISGMSAIKARRALSTLALLPEASPLSKSSGNHALHSLREYSARHTDGVELPKVDLEEDIAGYQSIKDRIRKELLRPALARHQIHDPDELKQAELLTPKGILFYGPPGTGKTYFAKAIATALQASLIVISGPELKSKWVGESEENLRRVFRRARSSAPSVIVFDEIDSFAQARGSYQSSGVEHSMVNQLLTEMDGFRANEQVFIIGTTNFLASVDPALLRPGRFELLMEIPRPDLSTRTAILEHYNRALNLGMDSALIEWVAQQTEGPADELGHPYTADHLQALCRGLKREQIFQSNVGLDKRQVLEFLHRDRPQLTLTGQERQVIATHECGHALIAQLLPSVGSPSQISLRPDGVSLGHVKRSRGTSSYTMTLTALREEICVLLGGLVAEQIYFGEHSVGAALDLTHASELSRDLWGKYGMATPAGLLSWSSQARTMSKERNEAKLISDAARRDAEQWMIGLLEEERVRAQEILSGHRDELDLLIKQLLELEEVTSEEIERVMNQAQRRPDNG